MHSNQRVLRVSTWGLLALSLLGCISRPINKDKEGLAHPATSSEQRESSEIRIALRADVMGGGSMGPWLLGYNVDLGCEPIGYVRHEDGGRLGIYHHALKNDAVFRRMAEKAHVLHAAGGSGKPGVVIEVDPDVPFRYVSFAMEALKAKGLLNVRVVARATDAIGRPLCIIDVLKTSSLKRRH